MSNPNKVLLGFTVLMLVMFGGMNIAPAQTAEQIAEKALAATVYLEMKDRNGATLGFGSGFFVRENLIATNYHVIEGAARGTAKLVGKYTTYTIQGVAATDETNDLALLKVNAYGIKPLPLGDSDNVRIGTTVYVAGNPKGLEGTFSDGIISSRRDRYTQERLQMTAPISPGSSGGPVLNRRSEVIGVSFMTLEGGQNLNFAIPSRYLRGLLARSGVAKSLEQGKQSISAETYFKWGNTKYKLRDYKGAIANYTKSIQLKPDANAYYMRGFVKALMGQHFAAITDYDTAIELKPDSPFVYNTRGLAKYDLGQHFAAITDYDTAIELKPNLAIAYCNRGNAKVKLGQYFAAITDYDTAIELKPNLAIAYYYRGWAKRELGQHLAAVADYDQAIQLEPNDPFAYNGRGNAKAKLGQYFAAITDYDTAIELFPGNPFVYYDRGNVKGKLRQYAAAIADYDTAIKLFPDYAEAYYNRGLAKGIAGRYQEGKQDLRTALRLAEQAGNPQLKAEIEEYLRVLE